MFWKRKKQDRREMYLQLRGMALAVTSDELQLTPDFGQVWGCLVEFEIARTPVTLVVFGEGTVSLYLGTGGGFIGCGQHEKVRVEGMRLLRTAEANLALFGEGYNDALPETGEVKFHVRAFDGPRSGRAREAELVSRSHPLSEVFFAANDVITQVRLHAR